jgi:hypothetical protein
MHRPGWDIREPISTAQIHEPLSGHHFRAGDAGLAARACLIRRQPPLESLLTKPLVIPAASIFVTFVSMGSYNVYMTKNPIFNAGAAILYITGIVSLIFYGPSLFNARFEDMPEIFAPVTMLSLFVFSAAVMGYLFLYEPILMILGGEKKQGTLLFLQTTIAFGVGSLAVVAAGLIATALLF